MKYAKYLISLAALWAFSACEQPELAMLPAPEDVVAPVLHQLEDMVITAENQDTKVDFTWDAADFSIKSQISYSIEIAKDDESPKSVLLSGLAETKGQSKYEDINQIIFNKLEYAADKSAPVNFYVAARIGESDKFYSPAVTINVTPTAAEKVYPSLFIVGSYNGWSHDRNQYVFDFANTDTEFSGIIDFGENHASNEFKLTGGAWGKDEHSMAEGQTPEAKTIALVVGGGSNINVYQKDRYYHLTFTREGPALKVNFTLNSMGISGDFNGWGWTEMTFDFATQKFYADIEIPSEGGLKFRECAENWDQNWGAETKFDEAVAAKKGVLNGGENIKVPAGNYRMYLNMNNPEELRWELNANDYGAEAPDVPTPPEPEKPALEGWGVVGDFTGWEDGKDVMMTQSAGFLVAKGIELKANEGFKIRKDGGWDENKGASGEADLFVVTVGEALTLVDNGKNLAVPEDGKYDIYFDEENDEIYVLVAGSSVPGTDLVASEWGLVGDFNGWAAPDATMYVTSTEGMFAAYGVAISGGFKIRANEEWNDTKNYGLAAAGSVEVGKSYELICGADSKDMNIAAGTYDIWFDLTNSKVYILEPGQKPEDAEGGEVVVPDPSEQKWHIVGDFNDWNPGDEAYLMKAEGDWFVFRGFTTDSDTGLKFAPGAWNGDQGGDTFELGTEIPTTAGNIPVPAGKYDVYFNPVTSVYKFEEASDLVPSEWGLVGAFNNWAAPDATMYVTSTEGMFAAYGVAISGGFKIRANEEWNDTKNYGLAAAGSVEVGKSYELICGADSKDMNIAAGTYDIWFDLTNSKVYILEPGQKPEDAEGGEVDTPDYTTKTWHVVGAFNNWTVDDAAYVMSLEGDWFVFKGFAADTDTKLKFAPGSWDFSCGGDSFALDTELPVTDADISVPAGKYDLYLKKDFKVYKFVAVSDIPTFEPEATEWGLVGVVNDWGGNGADVVMYTTETADLFVAKNAVMPDGAFKIRANNEWNDAANYGLSSKGTAAVDHVYDLICGGGSQDITLLAGTYDIYFDLAASKVYVMTPGKPISEAQTIAPPAVTAKWFLVGGFNGWATGDSDYAMTLEGDWYVFKGFVADGGEVKFNAGNWDVNRGGSFSAVGAAIAVTQDGANIKVPAGTYDVYMNAAENQVYFMAPGAIPGSAVQARDWYLVGDFNSWTVADSSYKMSFENGWYVFKNFVSNGGKVKLNAGTWDVNRGGNFGSTGAPIAVAHNGADIPVPAGTYDVYMNADEDTLYFMNPGSVPSK